MRKSALILSTILANAGLVAPAFADDGPFDDEVIATGTYLSIDKINAVKTPTPIIDIPQSLTIITAETIRDQSFQSIGDITRYSPGVNISQGEGHRDAIIIRGNQTTADFFQDGVRDDVQYYRPLYNLQQVEILRGANALLFGRGGVGGIVNRVTKTADSTDSFTTLDASIDTFGAAYGAVDYNQPLSDRVGLRVNGFVESLNNHRDFFDGDRFGINPTLGIELGPQTALDLSYEYLDDDRVVDRGVPSVNVATGPDVPLEGFDNTFFGSPDQNFTTLQAHILRGRADHQFNDMLRGNVTLQYADYDKVYQNLYASEEVVLTNGIFPQVELDGYRDTTDRNNFVAQANLVGEFDTGPIGHTVLVGVEYASQHTDNARLDNVFAQNNDDQLFIPFSDPLNIPAFGFTDPARDRKSNVYVLSAYAQNQIDLTDQFKVVLGARFDSFDIDVTDIQNNAQFTRKDEEITPRIGAIFKPVDNMSFYASYSETFTPRSGDQFLTLDLDTASTRPQFTENLEAGAKWDVRPDLSVTAAIFQLDREGFTSIDPNNQQQLITIDGASVKGLELQLIGQLTQAWSINAGYSYLDGEVEDLSFAGGVVGAGGLDGNEPRQTPTHTLSVWNNYQLNDRLGLGLGATYQDSYFVREDNSVEVPDFVRVDAALFYDVSDDLRLQLNVENLFDTDYFPDAHSNDNISTGAPINARFTVMSRF
ncbi:TonB-dependent receptor [Algimonas porphyrae]|uniref:Iron transport outer membrane receptor n=1 Tax=Algimonas porphyrae TaxID=1128113 RepID=A0ABQ5V0R6_9PROT|nr:TonB-dependent siderophore receptor [Algimonas porphyrae]GLQ20605.1 iron transport outer membrane receptor [Algimonas porphyrae]